MFCSKCGTQVGDDAGFCHKCGQTVNTGAGEPKSTENIIQNKPPKSFQYIKNIQNIIKTIPVLWKIIGIVVSTIVSICVIIYVVTVSLQDNYYNDEYYINMVKNFKPQESAGISVSYEELIDDFITFPSWEKREKAKDIIHYVDITGTLLNSNRNRISIVITFIIKPIEGKDDWYTIDPYFIELDGKGYGEPKAKSFILDLSNAYVMGYDSIANFYDDYSSRDFLYY